jgi:ketosteroid isomerase-like protein
MPIVRVAIFVLVAGLLAPVAAHAASLDEQVKAAYTAWDAAFNKSDAKAVAAFYADDAVLLPPTHDVIKGPAEIEKFWAGLFGAGVTGHKLELIEANGAADMAVAAARWSAKGKDGASLGGIATHEFAKQADGSLKLRLQTFN